MRAIIRILFVLGLSAFFVACGGGGSGGSAPVATVPPPPPPPPPPPQPVPPPIACTGADTFPSFLYQVEATATSPAELHLASSDACRSELIAIVPGLTGKSFHMTSDGSAGVILWSEDISNQNQNSVRRLDFTVDNSGVLAQGQPITVLPIAGEEALPGDNLFYRSMDIWGDATHDSLYLTIRERRTFNSGPNAGTGTRVAQIYDLTDLTDVTSVPDRREIYNEETGGWQDAIALDCSSVLYPQFVPTCYGMQGLRFNPSGTRLYIPDDIDDPGGQLWNTLMRIHIDMGGGPTLADWTITGPELVFTAPIGSGSPEQFGIAARPDNDPAQLPSPETIAVYHQDGGAITQVVSILDADKCADDYAPYATGTSEAPFDLWNGCVDNSMFFTGNLPGRGDSWQSPEALLKSSYQDSGFYDIHRVYVSGALAGTEQLMIETARFGDSGN